MSFSSQFILSLKVYNRTFGLLYRDAHHNPRPNKVASASLQFSLILLVTGLLSMVAELDEGATVIVTLLTIRLA